MEEDSDRPHLARKILDSGAGIRPYRHDARGAAVRAHLTKLLGVLVWGERNSRPGYDLLI